MILNVPAQMKGGQTSECVMVKSTDMQWKQKYGNAHPLSPGSTFKSKDGLRFHLPSHFSSIVFAVLYVIIVDGLSYCYTLRLYCILKDTFDVNILSLSDKFS